MLDKNNKYKPISDCLRCGGTIFSYRYRTELKSLHHLYSCFQCGRLYTFSGNAFIPQLSRHITLKEGKKGEAA